jgi:hypothetical protein
LKSARKADPNHDRVILENPGAVRELDALLVDTNKPYIRGELARTGYADAPPAGERWILTPPEASYILGIYK